MKQIIILTLLIVALLITSCGSPNPTSLKKSEVFNLKRLVYLEMAAQQSLLGALRDHNRESIIETMSAREDAILEAQRRALADDKFEEFPDYYYEEDDVTEEEESATDSTELALPEWLKDRDRYLWEQVLDRQQEVTIYLKHLLTTRVPALSASHKKLMTDYMKNREELQGFLYEGDMNQLHESIFQNQQLFEAITGSPQ